MADGGDDGTVAIVGDVLDGTGPDAVLQSTPTVGNAWFKEIVYAFTTAFKKVPVPPTLSMLIVSPRAEGCRRPLWGWPKGNLR